MAVRLPKIPKVRVRADMLLQDGSGMSDQVLGEGTPRLQDLLTSPDPFFPFVDETGTVHLINKSSVVQITPHD